MNPTLNKASLIHRIWKLASLLCLFASFLIESLFQAGVRNLFGSSPEEDPKKTANRIAEYSNRALRILAVRTYLLDVPAEIKSGLIVSNHLSYLDVMILSRATRFLFVTSVEVKRSSGIGLISRLSGALVVNQKTRARLKSDSLTIQELLANQISLLLFPEGEASKGLGVQPFRSAFFQTAINAQVPIHLFQLKYDDEGVEDPKDRNFWAYLFKLCSQKKIRARVSYLGRLRTETLDRKTLAYHAESRIRSAHAPFASQRSFSVK